MTPSLQRLNQPVLPGIERGTAGRTKDAAVQFEALLIEQMLKSARAAGGGGWMGEDAASAPLSEMAEQQFAQLLAANGGMGLAKLVSAGLSKDQVRVPSKGGEFEDRASQSVESTSGSSS